MIEMITNKIQVVGGWVWKNIFKRIGGLCWSIFQKFLNKIIGVGVRAAISSMLVISLLFLVIGLVFVVAPEKVCGVVGNFINILVGKTIVFQVAGALLLFFSGFINCVTFSIYGKQKGEEKFKRMQEEANSIQELTNSNKQQKITIDEQSQEIEKLKKENKGYSDEIEELKKKSPVLNMTAITKVRQLGLVDLDFDFSHVVHKEKEVDQEPKRSTNISKINKYKKWFMFGYVKKHYHKTFGVDLDKLKFEINMNEKKILVYGVEADSMGVKNENTLDEVFFEYKKYFTKKDASPNNDNLKDKISEKLRERERKRYDLITKEKYEYWQAPEDEGEIKFQSSELTKFKAYVEQHIMDSKNSPCSQELAWAGDICRGQFEIILDLIFEPMGWKIEIADCQKEPLFELMSFQDLCESFKNQITIDQQAPKIENRGDSII